MLVGGKVAGFYCRERRVAGDLSEEPAERFVLAGEQERHALESGQEVVGEEIEDTKRRHIA